jgi:hypothetical protein
MEKLALKVAGVIFLLISAAHVIRVFMKIRIMANQVEIPLQASPVAAVFTLALAVWMFRAAYK